MNVTGISRVNDELLAQLSKSAPSSKRLSMGVEKHGLLTACYMPRVRSHLGETVLTLESDCDSTVPCMRLF